MYAHIIMLLIMRGLFNLVLGSLFTRVTGGHCSKNLYSSGEVLRMYIS